MFRTRIRENYDRLTPSFKRLGEYLLDNYFDAAFMTASQLASQLEIDPATVVRFSQRLGYRGYPELLSDVRTAVRNELEEVYKTNVQEGSAHEVMLAIIEAERSNLEDMTTKLNPEDLEQFFAALESANRTLVISQWASLPMANLFVLLLRSAGLEARVVDASASSAMSALYDVEAGDVALSISLADVGPDMGTALQFAREKGAKTFSIATWGSASAARPAEIVFITPGRTPNEFPSFAVPAFFLSTLFQALMARRSEKVEQVLQSMKEAHARMSEIRAGMDLSDRADELWD
jgi:DNA-binding MurR/RpiR family transcriptional regulator